ncbi:SRPBCC family protein [Amycolatopsis sp. SID8362]|uniref:SRPBCC family protein n=1 Tax=Amycolatopsis sp. SID8362 TaxID=2690346 RepID=UPI0013692CB8|nr:SRPBCC family protein [Amycolatopsis sp. SID8362]NBH12156.1 dimethyladenosine transferase [Amycolatopsis sp. SID8362]NED48848.1 dimethyladenosine transferase [Amycolatopsis sp. SID8362]
MSYWVQSVERRITAPADRIYALIADPVRHKDFDGSGTLVEAVEVSSSVRPLGAGDWFSMTMDFHGKYTMTSTVVEAVPGERFAWQCKPHAHSSKWRFIFGGRIWRYELESDGDTTLVRETWDLREERLRMLVVVGRRQVRVAMRRTLDRIAALLEAE